MRTGVRLLAIAPQTGDGFDSDIQQKFMKIISGGQTGVDRGALDAARALGLDYGGWCPHGGLAEDYSNPPGLLTDYPALEETPTHDYLERTEWNVRDADATLIIAPQRELTNSGGTGYTFGCIRKHNKDHCIILLDDPDHRHKLRAWLGGLDKKTVLNVAGPRESKSPGIAHRTYELLCYLLTAS